jgi:DNA polymerase-3 subunit alpha
MSNGTYFDSTVDYADLIQRAKDFGMDAIAITEHGNVLNWIDKKNKAEKLGIKYIHGSEFYLTFNPDKQVRETYHVLLYAKNYEGVKELNRLSSLSYEGVGEKWYPGIHYYYRPRITFEELKNTSDNIIVSTACLASPLNKVKYENVFWYLEYIKFLTENKHRCFLEVQPHIRSEEQKEYNKKILELSKETGIRIIAGTDTHVLDKEDNRLREVLQSGKHSTSEENGEELFDLHFRSHDELVDEFKVQGVLSDDEILTAISNTNVLADMCGDWELDRSFKYPNISENPDEELKSRIELGIAMKNINSYDSEKKAKYLERINEEYEIIKSLNMSDYFILLDDISDFCKANNIVISPRGSANGSQMLWSLGITDVDAIKYNTLFFRFINPNRVSAADCDLDMAGEKRPLVKDYMYNRDDFESSAIVTFKKLALKGACRLVAKGLGYDLEVEDMVAKDIHEETIVHDDETEEVITTFENEEKWRKIYPEWIELAYKAVGIVEYTSVHACGFVAFSGKLDEEIGFFRTKKSKWIISQNDMKALDSAGFTKMDFLVVDNVQIVSEAIKEVGIDLHNDNIDLEDEGAWSEFSKSGIGIFQFEKSGYYMLKKALENYDTFKKYSPDITRYDIMLMMNGVIRPSCESFRDEYISGVPLKTGVEPLDNFLQSSGGRVIFQEQIMKFLENFCGYTGAESDTVRRAIAKKGGTEKLVPEIRDRFNSFFPEKYGVSKKESDEIINSFIDVIISASHYGFSINHSTPYTLLGYKNAYLRHYHPLEYFTSQLNVNDGKFEKTSTVISYIKQNTDIKIEPIKFRKSASKYKLDKETNSIFKGLSSIKTIGHNVGDELYGLRFYSGSFTRLLHQIVEKTSVNKTVVLTLIQLGFFSEFGNMKKLATIHNMFYDNNQYKKKTAKKDNFPFDESLIKKHSDKETEKQYSGVDFIAIIEEIEYGLPDEDFPLTQKISWQLEFLGNINYIDPDEDERKIVVTQLDKKYSPKFIGYSIKTGKTGQLKVKSKARRDWKTREETDGFDKKPFKDGDILYCEKFKKEPKRKKVGDDWIDTDEIEDWVVKYEVVERS